MFLGSGSRPPLLLLFVGFFGIGLVPLALQTVHAGAGDRVEPICNPFLADEIPASGEPVARLSTGSEYRICIPKAEWQHLVVYIHGTNFGETSIAGITNQIELTPQLRLPDVINLPALFGIAAPAGAFATLSRIDGVFSEIVEARAEIEELVELFWASLASSGRPRGETVLIGVSQGGHIGTSLFERDKEGLADGVLSACAPIGEFQRQLDYSGDVLNVFDYYFAELLPAFGVNVDGFLIGRKTSKGTWPKVPYKVRKNWLEGRKLAGKLKRYIRKAGEPGGEDFDRVRQFLRVTRVATVKQYRADPNSTATEVVAAVQLGVLGLNDTVSTIGPFYDNRARIYSRSEDDPALNAGIQRFDAKRRTLRKIKRTYENSGEIDGPLVTLHTSADPRVPFWHEIAYLSKATASGASDSLTQIPVLAFGHCNFSPEDAANALLALYAEVLATEY